MDTLGQAAVFVLYMIYDNSQAKVGFTLQESTGQWRGKPATAHNGSFCFTPALSGRDCCYPVGFSGWDIVACCGDGALNS